MKILFAGAVGTVTGSKYLIDFQDGGRVQVDCGIFQGYKKLREKNWEPLPYQPSSVETLFLTHAHLDHSGYIPLFIKNGFKGKIICTHGTKRLCEILLLDSAHLQESDANYANKKGSSKHHPALPLYSVEDAENSLQYFHAVDHSTPIRFKNGTITFHPVGHILGACYLEIEAEGKSLVFSGDLGRYHDPTMQPPTDLVAADVLTIESTYGNKTFSSNLRNDLVDILQRNAAIGGTIVTPAFAVGRAQMLLYLCHTLMQKGEVPSLPIFLDSPLALEATKIFLEMRNLHKLTEQECKMILEKTHFVKTTEESKKLSCDPQPKIIVSASGMATGGRVLHHIKAFAPSARNTILLVGYQAGGTRGAILQSGAETLKMHGELVPIRAQVISLKNISSHADQSELLKWIGTAPQLPKKVFITHGEPEASETLRNKIRDTFGISGRVPEHMDLVEI